MSERAFRTNPARRARIKERMFEQQRGRCYLCKRPMVFLLATFDHVIPRSKGGSNAQTNLKLAHLKCNMRKDARLLPTVGSQ